MSEPKMIPELEALVTSAEMWGEETQSLIRDVIQDTLRVVAEGFRENIDPTPLRHDQRPFPTSELRKKRANDFLESAAKYVEKLGNPGVAFRMKLKEEHATNPAE